MSKLRKIALVAVLGFLCLLILGSVAALFTVRTPWFREQVRVRIVREIETATGGRAEIGSFDFDWRKLRAQVRQFVLHGTEGPGEPPLLQARAVEVGLRIVSFLQRDIDIDLLALDTPRLHIAVYEDGRTNLPHPKLRRPGNSLEQILALAIRRFRVDNGLIEAGERSIPVNLRGEELKASFSYERFGPRYTGQVGFRRLELTSPFSLPLAVDAEAAVVITSGGIDFPQARLGIEKSSLRLAGALHDIRSPRAEFSFEGDLFPSDLTRPLRLPLGRQGSLAVQGKASFAGSSDYSLEAKVNGSGLAFEYDGARIAPIRIASEVKIVPDGMDLRGLRLGLLGGSFAGRASLERRRSFRVDGDLKDVSVEEVLKLRGYQRAGWSGRASGPVRLAGEFAGWRPRAVTGNAKLDLMAATGSLPVHGTVEVAFDQARELIEFADSHLTAGSSTAQFSGDLEHGIRLNLETRDLSEVLPAVAIFSGAVPASVPIELQDGVARFSGTAKGTVRQLRFGGQVSLSNFLYEGRRFDHLSADVTLSEDDVRARNVTLRQQGATLRGEGRVTLANWNLDETGALDGSFSLSGLDVQSVLKDAPVHGVISGSFEISGTKSAPAVAMKLIVPKPAIHGEQFDRLQASIRYAPKSLDVVSVVLDAGPAKVQGKGVFTHPEGDWHNGALRFQLSGDRIPLARVRSLLNLPGTLEGTAEIDASGEARIDQSRPGMVALAGAASLGDLVLEGKPLGQLRVTAETKSGALTIRTEGKLAGASISGQSLWRLEAGSPAQGEVRFTRMSLSSLRPWWTPVSDGGEPPIEAFAEGRIVFSGRALDPGTWKARVEMPALELASRPEKLGAPVLTLRNEGPVIIQIDHSSVRFESVRLTGKDTNIEASGAASLQGDKALQLRLLGGMNLALLSSFEPNLTASGDSRIDANIRGTLSRPLISGRLEFKNASFYLNNVPNGLDKAGGVILFSGDRATIENITAETGGGKLTLNGFIDYGGKELLYRLQAFAAQVRVRYPEGVSTTANAALSLTGTTSRSLLSGTLTILRSGITQRVDLAGLVGRSAKAAVAPSAQNEILRGMQFDIRVNTSADAKFETALTRDIQAEADLRLRGTSYRPVLLGRASITQGEVLFFGNRYNISRGDILFVNPAKLEPVLNLDLETRVRGISVTITVSGPPNKLSVTYRSDPPLQPGEIIALLAVGRAPTSNPSAQARQAEMGQGWGQLGAATVLGQALTAPVAGHLQRFFGVSRIKVDPRLSGIDSNTQPHVMLEQQVSKDITFTYITDLSKGQQQVIRVEWNVNREWTVQALRQETGIFGIDFLYRRQFK